MDSAKEISGNMSEHGENSVENWTVRATTRTGYIVTSSNFTN